jgi:hypothetical protein
MKVELDGGWKRMDWEYIHESELLRKIGDFADRMVSCF